MSITFYAAKFSSAVPVSCALAELGVPHERVDVELGGGALKPPELLALNPNGKVPTLVVDGTPMFECVAIVQWLGDRYGVAKGPAADSPARMTALAWTAWAYVTFGAELLRLNYAQSDRVPPELRSPLHAAHAKGELQNYSACSTRASPTSHTCSARTTHWSIYCSPTPSSTAACAVPPPSRTPT